MFYTIKDLSKEIHLRQEEIWYLKEKMMEQQNTKQGSMTELRKLIENQNKIPDTLSKF